MAIAGESVGAYRVWLDEGRLVMVNTTTLRSLCDAVDAAVHTIRRGGVATVAGADVDAVRMAFSREVQR